MYPCACVCVCVCVCVRARAHTSNHYCKDTKVHYEHSVSQSYATILHTKIHRHNEFPQSHRLAYLPIMITNRIAIITRIPLLRQPYVLKHYQCHVPTIHSILQKHPQTLFTHADTRKFWVKCLRKSDRRQVKN